MQNVQVQVGQLAIELQNRLLGKLPTDIKIPKREDGTMSNNTIEKWEGNTPREGEKKESNHYF